MLPIEDQQSWIRGVGWNLGMVFMVLEFLQRYSKAYVAHLKTWGFGLFFCMFAPELYLNHND